MTQEQNETNTVQPFVLGMQGLQNLFKMWPSAYVTE